MSKEKTNRDQVQAQFRLALMLDKLRFVRLSLNDANLDRNERGEGSNIIWWPCLLYSNYAELLSSTTSKKNKTLLAAERYKLHRHDKHYSRETKVARILGGQRGRPNNNRRMQFVPMEEEHNAIKDFVEYEVEMEEQYGYRKDWYEAFTMAHLIMDSAIDDDGDDDGKEGGICALPISMKQKKREKLRRRQLMTVKENIVSIPGQGKEDSLQNEKLNTTLPSSSSISSSSSTPRRRKVSEANDEHEMSEIREDPSDIAQRKEIERVGPGASSSTSEEGRSNDGRDGKRGMKRNGEAYGSSLTPSAKKAKVTPPSPKCKSNSIVEKPRKEIRKRDDFGTAWDILHHCHKWRRIPQGPILSNSGYVYLHGNHNNEKINGAHCLKYLQRNEDYFVEDDDLKEYLHKTHSWVGPEGKEFAPLTGPSSRRTRRRAFHATDELVAHVKKDNADCTNLDTKLKTRQSEIDSSSAVVKKDIARGVRKGTGIGKKQAHMAASSAGVKRRRRRGDAEQTNGKNMEISDDPSKNIDNYIGFSHGYNGDTVSQITTFVDPKHWQKLSIENLVYWIPIMNMSWTYGQSIESLQRRIDDRMDRLRRNIELETKRRKNKKHDEEERDYLAENKLYLRGVRDRTNKAESEALEKITYNNQWEEKQRWIEYKNRARKRSPQELAVEELLSRPVQFDGSKRSEKKRVISSSKSRAAAKRRNQCFIGESCELCNGYYASCIVTTKEIEAAGGCIMGALDQIQSGEEQVNIPSLSFRRIHTDEDIPDDRDDDEEELVYNVDSSNKSQRQQRVRRNDRSELLRLQEIKHTMQFIQEFNKGPLNL